MNVRGRADFEWMDEETVSDTMRRKRMEENEKDIAVEKKANRTLAAFN